MAYDWNKLGGLQRVSSGATGFLSPQERFIVGIENQLALYAKQVNYKTKKGARNQRWWVGPDGGPYRLDVRYGNISILPKGQRLIADDAKTLKARLDALLADAKDGQFADAIKPAIKVYEDAGKSRAGRPVKAKKAKRKTASK